MPMASSCHPQPVMHDCGPVRGQNDPEVWARFRVVAPVPLCGSALEGCSEPLDIVDRITRHVWTPVSEAKLARSRESGGPTAIDPARAAAHTSAAAMPAH